MAAKSVWQRLYDSFNEEYVPSSFSIQGIYVKKNPIPIPIRLIIVVKEPITALTAMITNKAGSL